VFCAGAELCSGASMTFEELAKAEVRSQPLYEPGKPIEDVARELGLDPTTIIKLASNENAFGTSPLAIIAAQEALGQSEMYPDGGCYRLREKLAEKWQLTQDQFVMGNGSNEILELLGHVFLRPGNEVVMGNPAFIVYKLVTLLFGATPVEVPLVDHRHDLNSLADAVTEKTRLVFVPSPNNPTGTVNTEDEMLAFARRMPDHVIVVFDEAYAEYLESPPDLRPLISEGCKVICLRTFSKIHGLAALRVGYGYACRELAVLLNRVRQPFNVNAIAQAAALAALDDEAFVSKCLAKNQAGLQQLAAGFDEMRTTYVPSEANFVLAKVGNGARIYKELQARGVIVRPMVPYGMPEWLRITVGSHQQNEVVLRVLKSLTQ
jgi:histidinol-phosphate aminotransferase